MERSWYHWDDGDLILHLRVQPAAKRMELVGAHGTSYRIRITAPPVDGKANGQLQRFLADLFAVPRRSVIIESGDSSRDKRVRIRGAKHENLAKLSASRR